MKTSIDIPEEYLKWIDQEIKTERFANRSHAIRLAIRQLKEEVKQK